MRIQILPLPPLALGDAVETPFIVAIDRLTSHYSMEEIDRLQDMAVDWGAQGAVFAGSDEEIEINPHLDLPEELRQALLDHLTTATTTETP